MTLSSLTSGYYPHPLGSFYSKCIAVGYLCNLNFLIFKIGIIITISQGYYEVRWANTESVSVNSVFLLSSYINIPFMMIFLLLLLRKKHFSSAFLLVFSCGSSGKESACNVGDLGLIPGSGRFSWRREWLPTPSILAWRIHGQRSLVAIIHGVIKSWTRLSD